MSTFVAFQMWGGLVAREARKVMCLKLSQCTTLHSGKQVKVKLQELELVKSKRQTDITEGLQNLRLSTDGLVDTGKKNQFAFRSLSPNLLIYIYGLNL